MWGDIGVDYSFESGNDWLVTNITQELSARLENSPLLDDNMKMEFNLGEPDNDTMYNSDLNDYFNICETNEENEINIVFKRETSPSSSCSETSSTEKSWHSKSDLDTPPVTPPNVVSPETICLISQTNGSLYSLPVSSSRHKTNVKAIAVKKPTLQTYDEKSTPGVVLTREEIQQQQVRRKQERMIRNRESAYLSRKRAKEHVGLLEEQVHNLTVENKALKEENAALKERLEKYETVPTKRVWRKIPSVPKKTTALLAIVLTVCINLNSISLFDDVSRGREVSLEPAPNEHHSRSLLWVNTLDNTLLTNLTTSCPVAINHTESLRLERELREWIVGGNLSQNFVPKHFQNLSHRKNSSGRKKRIPRARRVRTFPLDMWGLNPSLLDLEGLYEAIHRRADTFYLVSFSADHLLLPAVPSNSTNQRPKMSVMLPAFLTNASAAGGGRMEMMQIDCEVINTQQLSVHGDDIPTHLRQTHKTNNSTTGSENAVDAEYVLSEGPSSFLVNLSKAMSQTAVFSNTTSFRNKTDGDLASHPNVNFHLTRGDVAPGSDGGEPYSEAPIRLQGFIFNHNTSLSMRHNRPGN